MLAPSNITTPLGGPPGILGDRVQQLPSLLGIGSRHGPLLLWPDGPITRGLFALPHVVFATELSAPQRAHITDVFCLYSPAAQEPATAVGDQRLLHVADRIVRTLPQARRHQPTRLDPRGDIPVWRQLWEQLGLGQSVTNLPWRRPSPDAKDWLRDVLTAMSWRPSQPFVVLSPVTGGDKHTVTESWWRELISLLRDVPVMVPIGQPRERQQAQDLTAGTTARVIKADLDQLAALSAHPDAAVVGNDGGLLQALASARHGTVRAFYGAWPASAWALPNVQPLPLTTRPEELLQPNHPSFLFQTALHCP